MNSTQSKDARLDSLKDVNTSDSCGTNGIQTISSNLTKTVTTETTFGNLQIDKRFKKLERMLKLALLKNSVMENTDSSCRSPVPIFSNISSINGDFSDVNRASPHLNSSRTGSEVVSSSVNLKNILQNRNNPQRGVTVATSSVKEHPTNQRILNDSIAMPPPSTGVNFCGSKRKTSINEANKMINVQESASKVDSASSTSYVNKCNSHVPKNVCSTNSNGSEAYCNDSSNSQMCVKDMQKRTIRVFSKWKVMLNDQGQLIIKGTLECGKVARSKPVIRRLTLTSVESIYKHTYHLQGNIFDNRNELPAYIRGKFYNGFPDDWENVYQLWRSFISQGSSKNFRWPTPITDSDDDLKSEITDITVIKHRSKNVQDTKNQSRNGKQGRSFSDVNVKNQIEKDYQSRNEMRDQERESDIDQSHCDCSKKCRMNETPSKADFTILEKILVSNLNNKNKCEEVEGTSHNNSFATKETLIGTIQEDKLNIIINNLADKNCPPEYINKVIEMFDVINYVISYKSSFRRPHSNDHKESKVHSDSAESSCYSESTLLRRETVNGELHRSKSKSAIVTNDLELPPSNRVVSDVTGEVSNFESQLKATTPNTVMETSSENSDMSESETYAGIRKIPMERFLHLINVSKTSFERSDNKSLDKISISARSKKAMVSNCKTGNDKEHFYCDSAVSITEDEMDVSRDTKYNIPNNMRVENQKVVLSPCTGTRGFVKKRSQINSQQALTPSSSFCGNFENKSPRQTRLTCVRETPREMFANLARARYNNFDFESSNIQNYTKATCQNNSGKQIRNTCINKENEMSGKVQSDIITDPVNVEERRSKENQNTDNIIRNLNELLPKVVQCSKFSPSKIEPLRKKQKLITNDSGEVEEIVNMNCQSNSMPLSCASNVNIVEEVDEDITSKEKKRLNNKVEVNTKSSVSTFNDEREISAFVSCTKNQNKLSPTIVIPKLVSSRNNSGNQPISPNYTSKYNDKKFGSESNPKLLTAWIPCVVYNDDSELKCGLIFKGKLLNEAGYILDKRFSTDFILRRIMPRLIETINHEFYKLVGDLNDTKHVVPKQLLNQCQDRCPLNISKFCNKWKSLKTVHNSRETSLNAVVEVDRLSIPTSSRGRRILPPLNYWTGERVALKDNNPVYSPGNSQEFSIVSTLECTRNIQSPKDYNNQNKSSIKATKDSKEKQDLSNKKKSETLTSSSTNEKSIIAYKTRSSSTHKQQQQQFTSSDDEEEENLRRSRRTKMTARISSARSINNSLDTECTPEKRQIMKSMTKPRTRRMFTSSSEDENGTAAKQKHRFKLRKRKKIDYVEKIALPASRNSFTSNIHYPTGQQSSSNLVHGIKWSYHANTSLQDNVLSDEELSHV